MDFHARIQDLKDRRLFHSPFDFGGGIHTRPWHVERRFRRRLRLLQIPESLAGMTVLDIGAWDGFFSFEFERRGAKRVLAIDTFAWDRGGLDCFLLAREHFNSKVEYERLDVHDLDPQRIGTFDLVFCAGVLYHLRHPLLALEKIRSVTANQCILETHQLITGLHQSAPLITFFRGDGGSGFPGDGRGGIHAHGAFPTKAWVLQALLAAGFARNEVVYSTTSRLGKKLLALATTRLQTGRLVVHAFPS